MVQLVTKLQHIQNSNTAQHNGPSETQRGPTVQHNQRCSDVWTPPCRKLLPRVTARPSPWHKTSSTTRHYFTVQCSTIIITTNTADNWELLISMQKCRQAAPMPNNTLTVTSYWSIAAVTRKARRFFGFYESSETPEFAAALSSEKSVSLTAACCICSPVRLLL